MSAAAPPRRVPEALLAELRARTPLPALAGRYVTLRRASGRTWKGCCPFHQEKRPSFVVYDDHFHCFGCGAHGDVFGFLQRIEGVTFLDAVRRLAAEAGVAIPDGEAGAAPAPWARPSVRPSEVARTETPDERIGKAWAAWQRALPLPAGGGE